MHSNPDRWNDDNQYLYSEDEITFTKDHSYQVKHWVVPLELVMAMEIHHEIKPNEFVLLARIENLVQFGKGCYASDKWLAERHGCQERNIRSMLKSLRERGIIKIKREKGKNGKRYILTKWSKEIHRKSGKRNGRKWKGFE